ncbi:ABC transporter permease [Anaerotalea alkaliphila]|uniref:Iron ABC transporter permease n=1 Tax=Anaerotalea alkaliphila TaxID=2662126 RepID=A0A7X5KMS5_9FIRM|nr:iron ABC transporter permease [Anaerotalea alkaliphila]NDL67274.1 iron ABC transporter permease [Anaerotalea alkaliphila]
MNALNQNRKVGYGLLPTFLVILLLNLPVLVILQRVGFGPNENWEHFKEFLLADMVKGTLLLVLGSMLFTGLAGVVLAYLVTMFDFPLKGLLKWLLYIPITIPPYIAAYVYTGMLGYTGILQKTLRAWEVEVQPGWFNIMHIRGAIFIYTITLYPYVYGIVRAFLENHSGGYIDAARIHGCGPLRIFTKVVLPLVRVPLAGSLMLVMMEVVGDYGVVKYFNIRTVSSSIFSLWFGMGDGEVAIRLAFHVLLFILLFQVLEEVLRGKRRFNQSGSQPRGITPKVLGGGRGWALTGGLFLFFAVAFLLPLAQMLGWSVLAYRQVRLENLGAVVGNTLLFGSLAAGLVVLLGVTVSHYRRWYGDRGKQVLGRLTQSGYSIPGAVIAIGVVTTFVSLDNFLHPVYRFFDPETRKLVLSGSVAMLVFAFVVRYMAVGYNSVNAAFSRIGRKYNDAARTLGRSRGAAMLGVELPMLKNSLVAGFLLTFIDILKELPLTLLLRPFNYNTLASRAYEYANDERIMEASVPSLLIVLVSLGGVAVLARLSEKRTCGKETP